MRHLRNFLYETESVFGKGFRHYQNKFANICEKLF